MKTNLFKNLLVLSLTFATAASSVDAAQQPPSKRARAVAQAVERDARAARRAAAVWRVDAAGAGAAADAEAANAEVAASAAVRRSVATAALYRSIYGGDIVRIRELLATPGLDVTTVINTTYHGETLLGLAIRLSPIIARALLEAPGLDVTAVVNIVAEHDRNLLHLVALRGRLDFVRMLLSAPGLDVAAVGNTVDRDGETPAMLARRVGHEEIAQFIERYAELAANPKRVKLQRGDLITISPLIVMWCPFFGAPTLEEMKEGRQGWISFQGFDDVTVEATFMFLYKISPLRDYEHTKKTLVAAIVSLVQQFGIECVYTVLQFIDFLGFSSSAPDNTTALRELFGIFPSYGSDGMTLLRELFNSFCPEQRRELEQFGLVLPAQVAVAAAGPADGGAGAAGAGVAE